MLRSAASPGSVGFGRPGSGGSGLLKTPLPAGHLHHLVANLSARAGRPAAWLWCFAAHFSPQSAGLCSWNMRALRIAAARPS